MSLFLYAPYFPMQVSYIERINISDNGHSLILTEAIDGYKMYKCNKCGIDSWVNIGVYYSIANYAELNCGERILKLVL